MTRKKLWMMAAIVAIALTPLIGIGTAEAHGGGFGGGGFHGGGFHSGGFHDRFHDRRAFRGFRLCYGGFLGGYYPGYYGYRTCYLTVYGTTACY
jgi:hypothetical protein